MNTQTLAITLTVLAIVLALSSSCASQDDARDATTRIGVYDSRAVAVAFSGSPVHEAQLAELRAALEEAEETGDAAAAAQLDAEAKARQAKAHAQAFSTAPVDEILALIPDSLAEIQATAGVTALVSKWDEAVLKEYEGADTVDLSLALVDALHPTERQRESAMEIQRHKPIPLEQAAQIDD